MINARTIKSRIAAIEKRVGTLQPLVWLTIETPEGKKTRQGVEALDAVVVLVDVLAGCEEQPAEDQRPRARYYPYDGHIVQIDASELDDIPEHELGQVPSIISELWENIQSERNTDQDALC